MLIGGKKYSEIVIKGGDNELLVSISDDCIIENAGVNTILREPDISNHCQTCKYNTMGTLSDMCLHCAPDNERTTSYELSDDYKVENLSTADIAPERTPATWVGYSTTMMTCSRCGRHTARHRFKYCPHCGARMNATN